MSDTYHPNAEDFRNRAERAEQALAELAGHDGLSLAVALIRAEQHLATERANADRLAEALGAALRCFDICEGLSLRDEQAIKHATSALAAHNLLRIDG